MMKNSNIVIAYIKTKDNTFRGKTHKSIVKWLADSIKSNKATRIQKVQRGIHTRSNIEKKRQAVKKIENVTLRTLLPKTQKRREQSRVNAFSLLTNFRHKIGELSKANQTLVKNTQNKIYKAHIARIKQVQHPLFLRLKDFMSVLQTMINTHFPKSGFSFMKAENKKWKDRYWKGEFKKLLIQMFDRLFGMELYLYTNGDGVANLFDNMWNKIETKQNMTSIINREENAIYKSTINLYTNNESSREWVDKVHNNGGRGYNISTLTENERKFVENETKKFGNTLKKEMSYYQNNSE